jgi:hypothetical protein
MTEKPTDVRAMQDPEGRLEAALIEEYLQTRGYDARTLHALPDEEAKRVLKDASQYAAMKLAEVDARAHFVHDIHRDQ